MLTQCTGGGGEYLPGSYVTSRTFKGAESRTFLFYLFQFQVQVQVTNNEHSTLPGCYLSFNISRGRLRVPLLRHFKWLFKGATAAATATATAATTATVATAATLLHVKFRL